MEHFVLNRFGLKRKEEGDFLSFDDSYKLQELYPFSGIIDLHINRMNYTEYGDISISGLSDLISKTDNPGLAFAVSVFRDNYEKEEEKVADEDLLQNKLEEFSESEHQNLFLRKNYKLEAIEHTIVSEYVRKRKYLFEQINRAHKIYDLKKKWKAEKKNEEVQKIEKNGLNKSVASEKLAEIYLKQGFKDKAIEMYNQLILDNPEKSDYFAEILKKIN